MANKVRSVFELSDKLDKCIAWRKKEIVALSLLSNQSDSSGIVLRAAVALLYAHWEGAIKEMAEFYLLYISNQKNDAIDLKEVFIGYCIHKYHSEELKKSNLTKYIKVVEYMTSNTRHKISFPNSDEIVSTKSNLKYDVFQTICIAIAIKADKYQNFRSRIDELVDRRNSIAHGRYNNVIKGDYELWKDAILKIIDEFSNDIIDSAQSKNFLRGA